MAGEIRPALGCLPSITLKEIGGPERRKGKFRRFRVGPAWRGARVLAQRSLRPKGAKRWKSEPSLLLSLDGDFQLPFPAGADVQVVLYRLEPEKRRRVSEPISIPPRAFMDFGTALLTLGMGTFGEPVRFRAKLLIEDGEDAVLFDSVLRPKRDRDRWVDQRVDLSAWAGERARVQISHAPVPGKRDRPRPGRSFALWSRPRLLAPEPAAAGEPSRPDVLVVSLDTLRADHLGTYGAHDARTPTLDELARHGMVFESAMTTYPSTTASHMSLFTGVYPEVHRVYGPSNFLSKRVPMVTEVLAGAGYTTAAITENGMLHSGAGFHRGFDRYREFRSARATRNSGKVQDVVEKAVAWLVTHRKERTFLFLHTYQVHGPYRPPPEFDYLESSSITDVQERAPKAYAGEVAYTDHELGRLFRGLEATGRLDDTIVIVTSDHGEGFGEHDIWGHGNSLHEEAMRIPLIVHAPGRVPAGRRTAPVSLVDLAPTLLDLLDLDVPVNLEGRSLVPLIEDPEAPGWADRIVYGERDLGRIRMLRGRDTKWILGPEGSEPVVYRLDEDPGEQKPDAASERLDRGLALREARRAEAEALRAALGGAAPKPIELSAEAREQLEALGYLEPGGEAGLE